jgi:hypothetical protein
MRRQRHDSWKRRSRTPYPRRTESNSVGQWEKGLRLTGQFLNFMMIALTIAAGYFMTIQSLKVELSAKAEKQAVETLDKKLSNLELLLKEGAITKEEFFRFSNEVDNRLARIEYHLSEPMGDRGDRK